MAQRTDIGDIPQGDVFVPLIPPHCLANEDMRNEAVAAVGAMTTSILPNFDTALWKAWKPTEEAVALLDDGVDIEDEFMDFASKSYYPTMKEILAQEKTCKWAYIPPVPVDCDASEIEIKRRTAVLEQIEASVGKEAERRVIEKWDAFVHTCDAKR